MPDYEVTFIHKGRMRQARVSGDDFRDAYEALESLKANGVLSDEIIQEINAPEIDTENVRSNSAKDAP